MQDNAPERGVPMLVAAVLLVGVALAAAFAFGVV
jgi:hypothetical protein